MATEKRQKSLLWTVVLIVSICLAAVCLVQLALIYLPAWGLREVEDPSHASIPTDTSSAVPLEPNPIDFAALQAENPDIIGWIRVPGTVIDYPILQQNSQRDADVYYEGMTEDFYLNHDRNGKKHRAGAIYIQQMNSADFTDANTVIGGHYMANGTMFADLHKFRKTAFFNEHETAYVYTPGHIRTYRIYSAFVYDDRHILNAFDFHTAAGYQAFLDVTMDPPSMQRQVRQGITVTPQDRIITMTTCTARDAERYLVEGVLIHDQLTR